MMKALEKLDKQRSTSLRPKKLLFNLIKEHEQIVNRFIRDKGIPKKIAIEFADEIMKLMDKYYELTRSLIVEDDD